MPGRGRLSLTPNFPVWKMSVRTFRDCTAGLPAALVLGVQWRDGGNQDTGQPGNYFSPGADVSLTRLDELEQWPAHGDSSVTTDSAGKSSRPSFCLPLACCNPDASAQMVGKLQVPLHAPTPRGCVTSDPGGLGKT